MKKVRVFLAVATLLLVTAGVAIGKSRFSFGAATNLYYLQSSTYVPLATSVGGTINNFEYSSTTPTTPAFINPAGTDLPLYYYSGTANVWYQVYYK